MNLICISFAFLLALVPAYGEYVQSLCTADFDSYIRQHQIVLVKFYGPGCSHCEVLRKEFETACRTMCQQKSNITCAQVNTKQHPELTRKYNIQGIPTQILFIKGVAHRIRCNERQAQRIVTWATRYSAPRVIHFHCAHEVQQFLRAHNVVIFGFFKNTKGKAYINFNSVAEHTAFDDCSFGSTSEKSVFDKYSAIDGYIYLFIQNQKIEQYAGDMDENTLVKLLYTKICPVTLMNSNSPKTIFSLPFDHHLWIFLPGYPKAYIDIATAEAHCHRTSVLFSVVDVNNPTLSNLWNHFGIDINDDCEIPTMRMITKDLSCKLKPYNNTITSPTIKYFINLVRQGAITCYLKCAKPCADWNKGPVWKLTSKLFQEIAFNPEKCVLVLFYAPWCTPCTACKPAFEQAARCHQNRSDVHYCCLDMTANEVPAVSIRGYPTIILIAKNNIRHIYAGDRSAKSFSEFVLKHCV